MCLCDLFDNRWRSVGAETRTHPRKGTGGDARNQNEKIEFDDEILLVQLALQLQLHIKCWFFWLFCK